MKRGKAHKISLALYDVITEVSDASPASAANTISQALEELGIERQVHAVIVCEDETYVDILADTPAGETLLEELGATAAFYPCPPGDCEMERGACTWCGRFEN